MVVANGMLFNLKRCFLHNLHHELECRVPYQPWWMVLAYRPTETCGILVNRLNASTSGNGENFEYAPDIKKLCRMEGLAEALQATDIMDQQGMPISRDAVYCLLQKCCKNKDLAAGRRVHTLVVNSRLDSVVLFKDHLIRLYASCGSLHEANLVFCHIAKPSVYTWHAIMSAHVALGNPQRALEMYDEMQKNCTMPNKFVFLCTLKACGNVRSLGLGRSIHDQIVRGGLESDVAVGSTLVDTYSRCGSLQDARILFDTLPNRDSISWAVIIAGYIRNGQGFLALKLHDEMQKDDIKPDNVTFLCVLKACGIIEALEQGRLIHNQIMIYGLKSDVVISSSLVDMYAKCGSLEEARNVFDKMTFRTVVSWNTMVAGYAELGHRVPAMQLYEKMQMEGIRPDKVTALCILKACGNTEALEQGRLIHHQITISELKSDVAVGSALISMYAKCGRLEEARKVFDEMPIQDVVSWGAMIAGYAEQGEDLPALELFKKMQQDGISPIKVTFLYVLKACGSIGIIGQGRLVHNQIVKSGLISDVIVGSTLIDMYANCSKLDEAHKVFDELEIQDVVSWCALISAYARHGYGLAAVKLFEEMQQKGIRADKVTLVCILKACGNTGAVGQGRFIHNQMIRNELVFDPVVGNALVEMYAKCGSLKEAHAIFDRLPNRDGVIWAAMIAAYAQSGYSLPAFELFEKMQQESIAPEKVTFITLLKTCVSLETIGKGRLIHIQIIRSGLYVDVEVANSLIDMYARCGSLGEAEKVFNKIPNCDMVSWGTMIAGYAHRGHGLFALKLFERLQVQGIIPDKFTFSCILKACGSVGSIGQGTSIHNQIIRCGVEANVVIGNGLIDMYVKCAMLQDAHKVFENLQNKDLLSWGAMIAGYVLHGDNLPALQLHIKMLLDGIQPDAVIFSSILKACSSIGGKEWGQLIHEQIMRSGLEVDVVVGTALVDLYARCGSSEEACKVFVRLKYRNVASWGAMIAAYAKDGNCVVIRQCLNDMQEEGLKPDGQTYTSILAACSHAGQVEEGYQYLKSMVQDHGITPSIEHFNCVIDLLGRAGFLSEAEELLQTMPIAPDTTSWLSLLTACRTYGNRDVGQQCFDQVVQLDPNSTGGYVIMSNIYADAQMWEAVHHLYDLRKCSGSWKKPGQAWIKLHNNRHEFIVGDDVHYQVKDINTKVDRVTKLLRQQGFVPQVDLVLEVEFTDD